MKKSILFLAMFGLFTFGSSAQTKKGGTAGSASKASGTQSHAAAHTPTHTASHSYSESKPAHSSADEKRNSGPVNEARPVHANTTESRNSGPLQEDHSFATKNIGGAGPSPVNPSEPRPKASNEQNDVKVKTPAKEKKEWQCTYIYKDGHRCKNMTKDIDGRCWKHHNKISYK